MISVNSVALRPSNTFITVNSSTNIAAMVLGEQGTYTEAVVTVSPSNLSTLFTIYGIAKITPVITPANATNKKLTWSSSNTDIATVNDEGVVTGLSSGTVTITAAAMDGSGKYGTCIVTVNQIYWHQCR